MTSPIELQEYLEHCVAKIADIKTQFAVIDDGQIPKLISDLAERDNLLLFGILPSYGTDAKDEDAARSRDYFSFLILKKGDREIKHSEFIGNMQRCMIAANDFRKLLFEDIAAYKNGCSFLTSLRPETIKIDPLWNFCGMDGYEIYLETISQIG